MNVIAAMRYSNKGFLAILGLLCVLSPLTRASAAPGDLDFSFGVQGRQMILIPNNTHPNTLDWNPTEDIAFQPDGKILVAGSALDRTIGFDFTVTRFNADGSLDTSFANNGVFRHDFTGSDDHGWGIVLQPDGKIIIAGEAYLGVFNDEVDTAFGLIRLNSDGTFDSSFGTNGIVITNFFASLDSATEVALQPDGKIIATGYVTPGGVNVAGAYDFALVRYNPDGSIDTTFGTDGRVITDFNGLGDRAQTSVLQPDGKIVLAGWVYTTIAGGIDFGLARYNPDGSLDMTFDSDGKVVTTFGNNLDELARGIALAADGKLVVAGDFYNPPPVVGQSGHRDVAIARYNPNGSLDASFDGDGKFVYDSNLSDRNEGAQDVVVQPDGKILFVGDSHLIVNAVPGVSDQDLLIGRLNGDGTFDNSFGSGGRTLTDFGIFDPPGPPNYGSGRTAEVMLSATIGLQGDGKIIATNDSRRSTNSRRLAIARYHNDSTGPTPAPTATASPINTPSPPPAPTATPASTPTPTPEATPTATPVSTPGATPTPAPTATPAGTPAGTATPTPPPPFATPSATPATPPSQPLNISTRSRVQGDEGVLIGGFILNGPGSKPVIIRAIGPSLGGNGMSEALSDTTLDLYDSSGQLLGSNDNWRESQQAQIEATGLAPGDALESAILTTLGGNSSYTAVVRGKNATTGIGLVEVYDLGVGVSSKLANISTRGFVDTGDNVMIGGFIVGGGAADRTRVVVRAIGPTLLQFGITNALHDPTLSLYDSNGNVMATNDNWRDGPQPEVVAAGLAPQDDRESALFQSLSPGAYTAIVAGKSGAIGIGLVEAFNIP